MATRRSTSSRSSNGRSNSQHRSDGRGWYGDSQGHAEAAERGLENRGYGSSGNREYDDERGYSRSNGHSHGYDSNNGRGSYSRNNSNDYESGRGYGRFNGSDSQYDNRGGNYSHRRYNDSDNRGYGQSGNGRSYGSSSQYDNRGGNYSNSRYNDSDNDGRGYGHGGWFGDSEGHAEAARQRWGSRNSYGTHNDDNRSSMAAVTAVMIVIKMMITTMDKVVDGTVIPKDMLKQHVKDWNNVIIKTRLKTDRLKFGRSVF